MLEYELMRLGNHPRKLFNEINSLRGWFLRRDAPYRFIKSNE